MMAAKELARVLFAVLYRWRENVVDDDIRKTRRLFVAWEPPPGLEISVHYHFAGGGGVVIVETSDPAALFAATSPFIPAIEFDMKPVVNVIEATAIAMDVDEWVKSVGETNDSDRVPGVG